jgi:hypothetical protein
MARVVPLLAARRKSNDQAPRHNVAATFKRRPAIPAKAGIQLTPEA